MSHELGCAMPRSPVVLQVLVESHCLARLMVAFREMNLLGHAFVDLDTRPGIGGATSTGKGC
jgi:hypothetical protein